LVYLIIFCAFVSSDKHCFTNICFYRTITLRGKLFMNEDSAVWDDAYSVGNTVIDDQHKKLVVMINDLFQLDQDGTASTKAVFAKAFNKAGEYAQTHFNEEEKILEDANYPNLAEHKKQHVSFMSEVWKEFASFNEGSGSPVGLARFLKKWLLNHIAVIDKQYVPYLEKK
jgi:hemerythrin-like metal-binding protein